MSSFITTVKNIIFKRGENVLVSGKPDQGEFSPVYYEHISGNIRDKFNASSYPIYTQMFNTSNMGSLKHYDVIRFDNVILRLRMMSEPLLNDFYEENEVIEWLRVERFFFEFAYFSEYIYIEWDAQEEKYNLYIKSSGTKEDLTEDFKKTVGGEYKENNWYLNILTNEATYFLDPANELVRFSWFGRPVDMFRRWFNFCYKYEIKLDIFDSACLLFHKRLILERSGGNNAQLVNLDLLEKDLSGKAPYLNRVEGQNMVGFIPNPIMSGMELDLYYTSISKWVDRELSELGRLVNLNPKLERKTAGENDLAIDRQVDYLRAVLSQLKLMSLEMKEKGWPELSFKVNTSSSIGIIETPPAEGKQPVTAASSAPAPAPGK